MLLSHLFMCKKEWSHNSLCIAGCVEWSSFCIGTLYIEAMTVVLALPGCLIHNWDFS